MNKPPNRHSSHSPVRRTRPKQRQIDIYFGEYYRESKSSDSSISEINPLPPGNHGTTTWKKRNDSSTSNQSGYESSVSSNFTDCSVSTKTTPLDNKDYLVNLVPLPENDDVTKQTFADDNNGDDDVFDENIMRSVPSEITSPIIPSALISTGNQREKTLSSSSSYGGGGRKSVSFLLDVKTDDIIEMPSTHEEDFAYSEQYPAATAEENKLLHKNNTNPECSSETDCSLLLRPEFLGMQPTYV